jgi:hypothetical protein
MIDNDAEPRDRAGRWASINSAHHRALLTLFLVVVIAHWAEHIAQAVQIWGLGWQPPAARGVLGMPFPGLIKSETLHYGYALVMLAGLVLLRPGFAGRARTWWTIALIIQFWHHIEHLLLLLQAQSGRFLFGRGVPTSVLQLVIPRVELHLFYNTIVFLPMIVAMWLHLRPSLADRSLMKCSCRPATVAMQSA